MKKPSESKERWILLDAADSGYSVDNVVDLKELLKIIIEDGRSMGVAVYIVVSANEYEMAAGEQCFDVNTGKYLTFKDYGDYRKYILESRKRKDKRIAKVQAKNKI